FLLSSHHGAYKCKLPTPSSLNLFLSINCGRIEAPPTCVESCKYFPTTPLLFARPLGCAADFELSNILADSQVLAARITVFAFTWYSCKSFLPTYDTPLANPLLSVRISRTTAFVINSILPVFNAGITKHDEEEKSP